MTAVLRLDSNRAMTDFEKNVARGALRLIGWNAAWLVAGLILIAAAGEIWFRLTTPFVTNSLPSQFIPGTGTVRKPLAEIRTTNAVDFWTVSRTNSWGFLDREPISRERASASCHVAMIGDSFVEGREVAIPDKFHVQLEALAARERPDWNVTTSAFGISTTEQMGQLGYYDAFARRLRPKLVVLVFARNDFADNAIYAVRAKRSRRARANSGANSVSMGGWFRPSARRSYFAQWLHTKAVRRWDVQQEDEISTHDFRFTALALDRFRKRTDRDGAVLAILTSHTVRLAGDRMFKQLVDAAGARGVPVVDQFDYIIRRGHRIEDAHWAHDLHWNPTGHRWAAEALLEHLHLHPETCGGTRERILDGPSAAIR